MGGVFTQSPFSQPGQGGVPFGGKPAEAQSSIPPPPKTGIEVKIRTMEEDIAQMGKSGIQPTTITIAAGMSAQQAAAGPAGAPPADHGTEHEETSWKIIGLWILVAVIGAGVLFGAGYYLLPLFFGNEPTPVPSSETGISSGGSQALPAPAAPETPVFTHQSFLRTPADLSAELNLFLGEETYSQRLQAILAEATSTTLAEINPLDEDGRTPSWNQMLDTLAVKTLDAAFWSDNFEPDFTMLLFKDKTGLWPAYVLKLKSGKSPLILQSSILKMEAADANLGGLFASPPGERTTFRDSQLNGQPVRVAVYSESGATLIYGWAFNQYLVIGTSDGAWKEVLRRL